MISTMSESYRQPEELSNSNSSAAAVVYEHSLDLEEVRSKGNPSIDGGNIPSRTTDLARVPSQTMSESSHGHHFMTNTYDPRYSHYPMPNSFYPTSGHRRARSGDTATWQINPSQAMPNSVMRPTPHGFPMQHVHINNQPYGFPPNRHLIHTMSVDMSSNAVYEHLSRQSTSFVTLQDALAKTTKQLEQLEKEVVDAEADLNAHLSAVNPTKQDYAILRKENEYLQKEISEMVNECDKRNIPLFKEPAVTVPRPFILRQTGLITNEEDDDSLVQPFPSTSGTKPITSEPPSYISVVDPAPPYIPPIPLVSRPRLPLPLPQPQPPRITEQRPELQEDKWQCPKCTFLNNFVNECEICTHNRLQ